jgi:hypothetical protein
LAELEMKLQLTAEDVEAALESNSSRIMQRIPAAAQDVLRIKVRHSMGHGALAWHVFDYGREGCSIVFSSISARLNSLRLWFRCCCRRMCQRYRATRRGFWSNWTGRKGRLLPGDYL